MKCLYCHNPETQSLCKDCGACVNTCPNNALEKVNGKIQYNSRHCFNCDMCIKNCPNYASAKCTELEAEELYKIILEYSDFINGITISGGECTIQYEFIIELFRMLKEDTKLSTFIDTNGYVDSKIFYRLCQVTDGFMFDLKTLDAERHVSLTGLDNGLIITNMREASQLGLLYEVRTVIIEDFTQEKKAIIKIADFIKQLNEYTIFKLIPFRPYGVRTYLANYPPTDLKTYKNLYNEAFKILGDRAKEAVI